LRRILDRYILREVVLAWLAVTAVLMIILLTNQVAAVLERAADNQYPRSAVLTLIGLSTVRTCRSSCRSGCCSASCSPSAACITKVR